MHASGNTGTYPPFMPPPPRTAATDSHEEPRTGRPEVLDVDALAMQLKHRRLDAGLSQRQAAADARVSFSTWSRVESGAQPDLASYGLLCAWLRVPAAMFFSKGPERENDPLESALRHLGADPRLSKDAAKSISGIVRDMYDALASKVSAPTTVACHLRAAPTLRPGVPHRLASALEDMASALASKVDAGEL